MAMAALTGCQTSRQPAGQISAGKPPLADKPKPDHVSNQRAATKGAKLPTTDAGSTNVPARLAGIPLPQLNQPPAAAPDSAATKIQREPVRQQVPAAPIATLPLADGNRNPRVSIPDTVIIPASPASARLTMSPSAGAATPTDNFPSAVNLSRLDSATAELPAPHQPAVIRLPTLDDQPPARTSPSALEVFSRSALPDITFGTQVNPQGLRLPSAPNPIPLQTVRSNPFITLPLPAPSAVSWPTAVQSTAPAPGWSNWLASPALAPQTAPSTTPEVRAALHQKFYNLILGNQ